MRLKRLHVAAQLKVPRTYKFWSCIQRALVHGDLGSSRSSFSSWAEDYFMWQRLA